ncbi:hypothetical protein Cadr_000000567 [Camelus dromedarius]|uniref:Uncharacterized protein n=1 Tax=Camelus dromedarius TaxID=9838 RepID=A0A5N4EJ39_CAMDR|nr:hypothetical protein Cadr_000000567 [Camelus dromedarius]
MVITVVMKTRPSQVLITLKDRSLAQQTQKDIGSLLPAPGPLHSPPSQSQRVEEGSVGSAWRSKWLIFVKRPPLGSCADVWGYQTPTGIKFQSK